MAALEIDDFCAVTEASDRTLAFAKVSILSFLEKNLWFDGTIVILYTKHEPLSERSVDTLKGLYPKIAFINVDCDELDEIVLSIKRKTKALHLYMIKLLYAFSLKLRSKGTLYFSQKSIFLDSIDFILDSNNFSAVIDSNQIESEVYSSQNICNSIFYIPTSVQKNLDYSILLKMLSLADLTGAINPFSKVLNNYLDSKEIKKKIHSNSLITKTSFFPDKKFANFKSLQRNIFALIINTSDDNRRLFTKIHGIWNAANTKHNAILNKPINAKVNTSPKGLIREAIPTPNPIVNETDYNISVIVPAFKVERYIEECIRSISNQTSKSKIEILVGIDGCPSTKDKVVELMKKYKIRAYYNDGPSVGPYVIRNSLLNKANYDNILFFDADDVMSPGLVSEILKYHRPHTTIRFKYFNFNDGTNYSLTKKPHKDVAHGVFFATKSVLDSVGGFQPWLCGADTEFMKRCKINRIHEIKIPHYLFYRRIHVNSLTQNESTNHRSKVREEARRFINTNTDWSIPVVRKTINLIEL